MKYKFINSKGYTLVELIIAIAISSLVIAAASGGVYQLLSGNSHNSNAMAANRNIQQAGHWISLDILMAGDIIIDDEPETDKILTLTWTEFVTWKNQPIEIDGEVVGYVSLIIKHQVIYNLSDGNLQRLKYDSGTIREDEEPTYSLIDTRTVSQFINSVNVIHSLNLYQLEISSTVGGFRPVTEVKVYDVNKRPTPTEEV